MFDTQRITARVPVELLRRAKGATGKGTTETVRRGFELLAAAKAAADLRGMRGKVRLDLDLGDLRHDS